MLVGQKKKPGDASFNDDVALLADHWRRTSLNKENAPKMERLTQRQMDRTKVFCTLAAWALSRLHTPLA